MKLFVSWRTFVAFCVVLSILVGLGVYAYLNSLKLIDSSRQVLHTDEVLFHSQQVLSAMVDMETSQRGYTITGDSAFLDPYNQSVLSIHNQIDELVELTSNSPEQVKRINHTKELILAKMEFSKEAILERNNSFEQSREFIKGMRGKILMDSIRKSIASIQRIEKENLLERERMTERRINDFRFTQITLLTITIIVLLGVFISVNFNLSVRIAAEKKATELNKELEAFTYSVSHDLRAPLRSVDGYSKILKEDYSNLLDEEGARVINVIQGNARRMGNLIDDLLEFSRVGRKEMSRSTVNMEEIVYAIVREMEGAGNIEFKISQIHSSQVDVNMIRQVWINLISNAVKYSSQKSNVKIEISSSITEKEVWYSVKDNGVGFDMQYVHKLFNVFQRLHKIQEFEGTGVGLAIVKRIINRHGGNVYAEGRINEGAIFHFTIPQ
jgi:signal transduction histidine kinase